MKEITIKVPDNKINFFVELVNNLSFEVFDIEPIPGEHKAIVRERIETAYPDELIHWN